MKASGARIFTYEELQTIFIQAEAMLNSRPLVQTMNDDNNAIIITPGHFLTGRTLSTLPEPDLQSSNVVRRWLIVEKQAQMFWRIWSNDYLHDLQQRTKWTTRHENVQIGQIVLLKSDQLPKCQWNLAKITKLHPDADGVVRIVDIARGDRTDTRHLVKLCILPIYSSSSTDTADKDDMVQPIMEPTKITTRSSKSKASDGGNTSKVIEKNNKKGNVIKQPTRRSARLSNRALVALMLATFCMFIADAQSHSLHEGYNNVMALFQATVQTTVIRNMTRQERQEWEEQKKAVSVSAWSWLNTTNQTSRYIPETRVTTKNYRTRSHKPRERTTIPTTTVIQTTVAPEIEIVAPEIEPNGTFVSNLGISTMFTQLIGQGTKAVEASLPTTWPKMVQAGSRAVKPKTPKNSLGAIRDALKEKTLIP